MELVGDQTAVLVINEATLSSGLWFGRTQGLPPIIGPNSNSVAVNPSNNLLSIIKGQYRADDIRFRSCLNVLQAMYPGRSGFQKVGKRPVFSICFRVLHLIKRSAHIAQVSAPTPTRCWPWRTRYTYRERYIQVRLGVSSDVTSTSGLFTSGKMLREDTVSTKLPMWRLMMKNVYSLGAYQPREQKLYNLNLSNSLFGHYGHGNKLSFGRGR